MSGTFWTAVCWTAGAGIFAGASVAYAQAPAADKRPVRAVTLDALLVHAQQHAPLVVEARARLGLGDAALEGSKPVLHDNPELEVGAGPRVNGDADPTVDVLVRLQQRVELGGQRGARIEAARKLQALGSTRLDAARFAVRVRVRAAFYAAVLARERAARANDNEQVERRIVEIAQLRLQAGDIGTLGVRLAEADLAQASAARIEAEALEADAALELAVLAGWNADATLAPTGSLPPTVQVPDADELITLARRAQPERRIAWAELVERESRVQVAGRESWTGPTFGAEFAHESGNENRVLALVTLPLPFFARNQAARAQTLAERDIARADLDSLDRALPLRIRALRIALDAGAQRIAAYSRDVLPRFRDNLQLISRGFELGELDALQVSAARSRLIDAQRSALAAYDAYIHALAEIEAATGVELAAGVQP